MSPIAATDRHMQLIDSLRRRLDRLSKAPRKEEYCNCCGFRLVHINAHFWLDGSEQGWDVPLSYCANCNPGFGDQHSFAA
jgi:hypothetical protein